MQNINLINNTIKVVTRTWLLLLLRTHTMRGSTQNQTQAHRTHFEQIHSVDLIIRYFASEKVQNVRLITSAREVDA